jgi:DNA-binding transcriptional MerR regulator
MDKNTTETTIHIPVKLYRIGEVVRNTPFTRQTIHNYTVMGLIRESGWTEGGHRLYDESVFTQLATILELRKSKTLTEIRKILKNDGVLKATNSAVAS